MVGDRRSLPNATMNKFPDMKKRAKDVSNPHMDTTVRKFLQGVNDPNIAQVALDFPLTELSPPDPLQ